MIGKMCEIYPNDQELGKEIRGMYNNFIQGISIVKEKCYIEWEYMTLSTALGKELTEDEEKQLFNLGFEKFIDYEYGLDKPIYSMKINERMD